MLRQPEKLCKTGIRYTWLLDDMQTPSFATFGNFIREELSGKIEQIMQKYMKFTMSEKSKKIRNTGMTPIGR